MSQVRVNILTAVNADAIKIERKQVEGEDYAIIKDVVWHKDDIVLNGGLYCAAENEKGFASMEGRMMPFGHPQVGGKFVAISAIDSPDASLALAKHYGGVHAQNVRKEGASYLTDVMVNERLANSHKDGKLLMDWIGDVEDYTSGGKDKPSPVHMSTGVIANKLMNNGKASGKNYTWIALNQRYDHLAILFNEAGAGGDEIALAVNCELVINSSLDEAVEPVEEKGLLERLFEQMRELFSEPLAPIQNRVEYPPVSQEISTPSEQPMDKAELEGIIGAAEKRFAEQLTAVNNRLEEIQGENKALKDQLQANTKAADAENRAVILAKAPGLELTVNALSGEALAALASTYQTAAPLKSGFIPNKEKAGDLSGYEGV